MSLSIFIFASSKNENNNKTKIEGLIFEPQIFEDDRGSFESWNENLYQHFKNKY